MGGLTWRFLGFVTLAWVSYSVEELHTKLVCDIREMERVLLANHHVTVVDVLCFESVVVEYEFILSVITGRYLN